MQKQYRVRSRGEFQRIYQEGRSFANRAAVLYVLGGRAGGPRVGISVGRKLGSAVVRNRIRRRLREAMRELWPRIRSGSVFVLIGRAAARTMPFNTLGQQVEDLLKRAGLLLKEPGPPRSKRQ